MLLKINNSIYSKPASHDTQIDTLDAPIFCTISTAVVKLINGMVSGMMTNRSECTGITRPSAWRRFYVSAGIIISALR
jgi:hypothetical protein